MTQPSGKSGAKTVLFSFEGTGLEPIRVSFVIAIAHLERHGLQILENCMVKNFHVSDT